MFRACTPQRGGSGVCRIGFLPVHQGQEIAAEKKTIIADFMRNVIAEMISTHTTLVAEWALQRPWGDRYKHVFIDTFNKLY